MDVNRWAAWQREGFASTWLEVTFAGTRARLLLPATGPKPAINELFLVEEVHKGKTVLRVRERLGRVVGTEDQTRAILGKAVCKLGRTTGFTEGIVETIKAEVLNFPYGGPDRTAHFGRVMVVRGEKDAFAERGDSGGPVFIRNGGEIRVLGYVFGVATLSDGVRRALVLPIRPALEDLGYDLFTG